MTHSPRRIQLTTFGALAIGEGVDGNRRSRRALALLALAAAEGPSGVDRARVMALLWPESDTERAANSFRQVLHGIRRELGDGAIVYEGGGLRLNTSVFAVDLWDFEHAVRTHDFEGAAAAYRGPFLGSFHISGLAEFERWADGHRDRLRQAALTSLRALGSRADDASAHVDAVRWWRAVVEIDPLSSKNALGLLRALTNAGDRAGALDFARTYEGLVRAELETDVDESVAEYVALVRRGSHDVPAAPQRRVDASPERFHRDVVIKSSHDESLYKEAVTLDTDESPRRRATDKPLPRRKRWPTRPLRYAVGAAGAVLLLTAVATASRFASAASSGRVHSADVVAVMPLHSYDAPDSALSGALAALLSADLDGTGTMRSVPSVEVMAALTRANVHQTSIDLDAARLIARKLGADLFVTGDVIGRASGHRVSLTFHDANGDAIGSSVAVDSDSAQVRDVVDEIAGRLVAERYRRPRERLIQSALRSSASVGAIKAYLRGETALADGRYVDATDEFALATATDTSFALANYRLAIAAELSGRTATSVRATELAVRLSDKLEDRDRRLVVAFGALHDGHVADAERSYRALIDDYPDDCEASFRLGELLFHQSPLRGESVAKARPAFEHVLILDPQNVDALVHLARIASIEGRHRDVEPLARRALALVSDATLLEQRAAHAFSPADRPGVQRIAADAEHVTARGLGPGTAVDVALGNDPVAATERYVHSHLAESSQPAVRALGLRLLAYSYLARGRWTDARQAAKNGLALDRGIGISQLSLMATMPFVPMPRDELEGVLRLVRDWQPVRDSTSDDEAAREGMGALVRLHRVGLIEIRLGDLDAARHAALELEAWASPPRSRRYAYTLAQSIRARILAAQGHPSEALVALDAAAWEGPAGTFTAEAGDRYFRASLLQTLGRTHEATGWYQSIAERAVYELPYLAPAQHRLAEIARANGDPVAAKSYSDRAERLWRDADPAVRVAFR